MKIYRLSFKEFIKPNFLFYRASQTIKQISPHIIGNKILDIGSGKGHVSKLLQDLKFEITSVDIKEFNKLKTVKTIVFDGINLPFEIKDFDTALLLTVLHHVKEPEKLLEDALRVAKRVILIEDIYDTRFEKIKMNMLDSIFNFEFFNHPHNNKTNTEWKKFFNQNNCTLVACDYWITRTPIGNVKQALYVIENKN